MNLKDFLERKDSKTSESYWALVIEPGWIQAGIWEIVEEKVNVISTSPPAPWETDEEMIGAVDTALSAAVQNLPEGGNEPSKTVFGVIPSWVEGGQIKGEHLEKIKRICSELSLEPSGFVVLPEAIAHLIKFEEGTPINAVVLGIGAQEIDMAVFKLGSLVGTTSVARSVSISEDVTEGLTRFTGVEPLPSRFLIYDGKEGELEEDRQSLLSNDWSAKEKIKFLHTPKVEIVNPEKKVLAVCLAGASEIGSVTGIQGLAKKEEEIPEEKEENVGIPQEAVSASDLGFAVNKDITEGREKEPEMPKTQVSTMGIPLQETKTFSTKILKAPRALVTSLKGKLPTSFNFEKITQGRLTLFSIIFGVFVLSFLLFWWYFPKADVTIYVSPKKIEEKTSLFVDTKGASPDFSKLVLPGEVVKTSVSGDKTKSTSGTKLIGDKAKGSVKIENGTASIINFPAGTIIASANDLKFTTNSSASVSAALSPGSPGTATVDVTASDIGADYNLASNESFRVGNYPKAEVDAVATSNFTGGSSRQISAVSQEDQKSLFNDEESELSDSGKNQLLSNLSSDKYLISESVNATASSTVFSAKVGDEASTLKISLELAVSGISLNKSNLYDFAGNVMKGKTPGGFNLRNEQLTFSFEPKGVKGGVYEFEVIIDANLLPEVKPDTIAKSIAGKYTSAAQSYLKGIPGFSRAEIRITPHLPGIFGNLPRVLSHISVEVTAEK